MTAKNSVTGDTIATRPYSDKYGEGHDRIWGKKEQENKADEFGRSFINRHKASVEAVKGIVSTLFEPQSLD